ncbi:MAG: ABC transporter ATP-binding protein/permease [Spirochaetales bacterium]|nr:ABC transporter ATP-binding protein/permease [Spirochaetales bacterium]
MLSVSNISKVYQTGSLVQKALDDVSLSFRDTEFVAVLGPSGSGKTTLLNIIGGLDRYDSGEMAIDGVSTKGYSARDWDIYRNHTIGFIFQSYYLIPHQSILSNVELAMTLSGVSREERRKRALEALDRVGLLDQAHKKPNQLSGGQMQRVAVARALVNGPSVLLADEPTGALDSDTGEQVMQLLKEIATDHLVIMVTHNPDLAQRYATRVVKLKDGKVIEDTDPFDPSDLPLGEETEKDGGKPKKKRPSMSFAMSFMLSLSNLWSKKARTILVALAASIGIVGIALILSLSNGANAYIRGIERDSLSQYPLELRTSTFSMGSSFEAYAQMRTKVENPSEDMITEQQMMGRMLAATKTNDLAALKNWFDSGESGIDDNVRAIDYGYGLSPQIYLVQGGEYRQVCPDQTMAAFGMNMDDSLTSLLSDYNMGEVFSQLPSSEELFRDDYELLAGTWPEKDTDLVLALSNSDGIPDFVLYALGLKDAEALSQQISSVVSGMGNTTAITRNQVFVPRDFLSISFRLLPAYEKYEYDSRLGVWSDVSGDSARMIELLSSAETMTIVGVVTPRDDSSYGILGTGICYSADLVERLISQAGESGVVKAQLSDPETDVLTGRAFGEGAGNADIALLDLIDIHPEKAIEAVSIRWENLQGIVPEDVSAISETLSRIMSEYYWKGRSPTLSEKIKDGTSLLSSFISVDKDKLGEAFSLTVSQAKMQEMLASMSGSETSSLDVNLIRFGYADTESPSRISIFPKDFDSKNNVLDILDGYNASMRRAGLRDKVIYYTDYVGALMSSVTTIIDAITYVLITFVSISLVVSSIMIGIITYISVLERRKEIGILRALGASKRNISQVFNAETFIIGLLAGIFGIILTLVLQIPINAIIATLAEQDGIKAFLPAGSGFVLVLLCVLLTFIGGLIPSRKAARQDPVLALRSE